MKRLIAVTRKTVNFGIDTEKELQLIHQEDATLDKDKLHDYAKRRNEGLNGGLFYEMESGKIHLYVVEIFWFGDIDKKATDKNKVAFVASRLHGDNTLEEPQYVEIKDSISVADANVNNVTIRGMSLVRLDSQDLENAKLELAKKFSDFREDKLD